MSDFSPLQKIQFPKGAYLSHFSLDIPITCVIQEPKGQNLNVTCSMQVTNVLKGDPVVIKFINEENEYIITGDVLSVLEEYSLSILVTGIEKYKNNRKHKRYAVSLNAVVASIDSMDYICSTVKSISYSGISVNCKYNIEVGGLMIVSIITSTINVIHFIAKIVRKNQILDYFEYGVEISSIVSPNKEKLDEYVDGLEEEEKSFIVKAK